MNIEIKQVVKVIPFAKRPNISRISNNRFYNKTVNKNLDERADALIEKNLLESENKSYVENKSNFFFSHKVLFDDSYEDFAVPLQDGVFTIPKIGQYVIVFSDEKLNLNFYVASSLVENNSNQKSSKNLAGIEEIYKNLIESNKKIKNSLWPRQGSTQIKNENGKSYLQLDNNDFIISSGFSPLEEDHDPKLEAQYQEGRRFNPSGRNTPFIFGSNFDNVNIADEFANTNKLHDTNNELIENSESINETIMDSLDDIIGFQDKIKFLFGVSFESPSNPITNDDSEDLIDLQKNGLLIAGNNIYLAKPNTEDQELFKAGRAENIIWLLKSLIDEVKLLKEEVITHRHLGTPSSVLDPIITKTIEFDNNIKKIEDNLGSIKSSNVNIT